MKIHRVRFWILPYALATVLGGIPLQSRAAPLSIAVPCGTPGLRSCNLVLQGGGFTNGDTHAPGSGQGAPSSTPQAQPIPGIGQQLQARIQQQVDCYYQGVEHGDMTGQQIIVGNCTGKTSVPNVCDPVPNLFNNSSSEITQSHPPYSVSCGTPANIAVNAQVVSSFMGIPTQINLSTTTSLQGNHSVEFSYVSGAFVQAQACYFQQVLDEINSSSHQLTINDASTDSCRAFADDFTSKAQAQATTYATAAQVMGAANIGDVMNCQNSWTRAPASAVTQDLGELRQSSQYLCSARAALESAFVQLAACEVFSRSRNAWVHQLGTTQQVKSNLLDPLNDANNPNSLNSVCTRQCLTSTSLDSANQCANRCYQQNLGSYVQKILQNLWPNTPSAGQGCSADARLPAGEPGAGIFLLGSLGLIRRRKRRAFARNALASIALAIAGLACSRGSSPTPSTLVIPAACASGVPNNPASNCADMTAPGSGGLSSTNTNGTQSLGQLGGSSLGNANALVGQGGSNSSLSGGQSATGGGGLGQAATAGGASILSNSNLGASALGQNPSSSTASFPSLQTGGLPGVGGSSGGAGSSGLGGGSGFSTGNVATAPAVEAAAAPSLPDGLGAISATRGAYSTGGGVAPVGSGGGSAFQLANAFGTQEGSDATAGAGGLKTLGVAREPSSTLPSSSSEDPADYFARLDLKDNLFKIVEHRYRDKAMAWANEQARLAAQSVTRKIPLDSGPPGLLQNQ